MKLGKLLLGAGVVTSALAVSAGFGVQSASAEDADATAATAIDIAKIAINYGEQNIVVNEGTDGNDTKLYVGIGTYSAKTPTDVKVKKWIEYDNDKTNGVTIDTSSLAVTKKQYVVIKGDKNTKATVIQLAATPAKLAASIDYTDPAAPALSLKDITKGKNAAEAVKNVEFSVANGSQYTTYTAKTKSATGTDLTKYQKLGATLKVRQAASATIAAGTLTTAGGDAATCNEVAITLNGEAAKAYSAKGTFASKELKVKVAKLASGPKVNINYTKNTVSIPKTAQYRTAVSEAFANTLVADASKNTVVVPLSKFEQATAFTLDVRTAAKTNDRDKTKSKSASNITEVAVPEIAKCVSEVAGDGSSTAIGKDNFGDANLEKVTANKKVTLKYTGVGSNVATLTNSDMENAYDVYVTTDSKLGVVADKIEVPASTVTGAKKIAAGGRLTLKGLKDGEKIFIRVAGNAKKKTFASEYGAFGTVKLPKAAATESSTGGR